MILRRKHDEEKRDEQDGNTMKSNTDVAIFFLRKDNKLARLLTPSTALTKATQSPMHDISLPCRAQTRTRAVQ
jgi:hypothetical protein